MTDDMNTPTSPAQEAGTDVGDSLNALQGLISRLSVQMDDLQNQVKNQQEMLKNVFDNDEELQKAEEAAKAATSTAKDRKSQINESAQVKELKVKIGDLKEDLKLVQESLNTHLINYFQLTGSTAVDMADGGEREFKLIAKLKPRKTQG